MADNLKHVCVRMRARVCVCVSVSGQWSFQLELNERGSTVTEHWAFHWGLILNRYTVTYMQ